MTSQINPNNIDGNYPVAGVSNNTQGMRDNFTNTKTNFQYAANEITELQQKAILKSAITGTTLDNNMNDNLLYAVRLQDVSYTQINVPATSGTVTLDYAAGMFQQINTTGNISLAFTGWPVSGTVGVLNVTINITDTNFTVTLPSAVNQGITDLAGISPGTPGVSNTITFNAVGSYVFEFFTQDAGQNIYIFDLSRSRSTFPTDVVIDSGTNSVSSTTGALVVDGGIGVSGNIHVSGNVVGNIQGNIVVTGIIDTGNIIAGNLITSGQLTAAGNVTGGNVRTTGIISAAGNITGGNLRATGTVSISGNVITQGFITTAGNITGSNISTAGSVSAAGIISSAGNVIAANVVTANVVSANSISVNVLTGNVFASGLITTSGGITTTGATAGIGYETGAGGTVTQLTSKSTAVTLNRLCGEITMNNASLGGDTTVSFVLNSTGIANTDVIVLNQVGGGNIGEYAFNGACGAGNATISVHNMTNTNRSDAIVLRFAVIRAVIS